MQQKIVSKKSLFLEKISKITVEEITESETEEFHHLRRKLQNAKKKARGQMNMASTEIYDGDMDHGSFSSVEGIYLVQKKVNELIKEKEPGINGEIVCRLIDQFSKELEDNTFYEAVRRSKNGNLQSCKIYNVVFNTREMIAYLCKGYMLGELIQTQDLDLLIVLKSLYATVVFLRDGFQIEFKPKHERVFLYLISELGNNLTLPQLLEGAEQLKTVDGINPMDICDSESLKSGLEDLIKWKVIKGNEIDGYSLMERVEI